jgi:TetR/AcrR family tetracycline transcriptional repressor
MKKTKKTSEPKKRMPGRPPRSAGEAVPFGRAQVVDGAMKLLQEVGLEGLSTRRLAARLNVKSPALYWHVRNKDELLQLVADAICAQIVLPPRKESFHERLKTIANEYRRVLTAYRDAARLFAEQPPTGPHRMKLYDVAVETFLDGGFPTREAIAMATFYRHYLLGMITEEMRGKGELRHTPLVPAYALGIELQQMQGASRDYPSLFIAAKLLTGLQPEKLFTAGLNVILNGLEQRVEELRRSKRGRR